MRNAGVEACHYAESFPRQLKIPVDFSFCDGTILLLE
jgi:hypothetical protein